MIAGVPRSQKSTRSCLGGGTDPIGPVASRLSAQHRQSMNWMRWWFGRWLPLPPLFSLCHRQKLRARLSLVKPRTTILSLLKQDSDCIFICLYRGIHRPFFHSARPTESGVGANVRLPLGSTTYTPLSPHTGIELGPMTADGKDGDHKPSSRPREREGLNPSQILRKPPSRRQGMKKPRSHPSTNSKEEAREKRVQMPVPRLAYLGRPPWSWPVRRRQAPRPVPPCPSQSTTPPIRRRPNLFPSFPPPACFLSLQHVSPHPPAMGGASPLTRRASSEAAETDKASLTSPPTRPFRLLNRSRVAESAATRRRTERRYLPPASTDSGGRPPLPPPPQRPPPRDDDNAGT